MFFPGRTERKLKLIGSKINEVQDNNNSLFENPTLTKNLLKGPLLHQEREPKSNNQNQ
jgi:hypothetical protein